MSAVPPSPFKPFQLLHREEWLLKNISKPTLKQAHHFYPLLNIHVGRNLLHSFTADIVKFKIHGKKFLVNIVCGINKDIC